MESMCCGSNRQIHMDYRNPVEKKGLHGCSLSERGGPETPTWTGFYCFSTHSTSRMVLIYYAQVCFGWLPFTEDKGEDVAKEDVTSKKKHICKCKGKSGLTGYTPYLGGLAQILGSYFKDMQ